MEIPEKEVLRYLGCRGEPDPPLRAAICEASARLQEECRPRTVSREFACLSGEDAVEIGPLLIPSRRLAARLAGCDRAVLMAATLGTQADILIRKAGTADLMQAAVLDAVCAAYLEEVCDKQQRVIAMAAADAGRGARDRFSPGYGDFPLSFQPALLDLLEAGKRIGVFLTEGLMMVPAKSVTAVVGLYPV